MNEKITKALVAFKNGAITKEQFKEVVGKKYNIIIRKNDN